MNERLTVQGKRMLEFARRLSRLPQPAALPGSLVSMFVDPVELMNEAWSTVLNPSATPVSTDEPFVEPIPSGAVPAFRTPGSKPALRTAFPSPTQMWQEQEHRNAPADRQLRPTARSVSASPKPLSSPRRLHPERERVLAAESARPREDGALEARLIGMLTSRPNLRATASNSKVQPRATAGNSKVQPRATAGDSKLQPPAVEHPAPETRRDLSISAAQDSLRPMEIISPLTGAARSAESSGYLEEDPVGTRALWATDSQQDAPAVVQTAWPADSGTDSNSRRRPAAAAPPGAESLDASSMAVVPAPNSPRSASLMPPFVSGRGDADPHKLREMETSTLLTRDAPRLAAVLSANLRAQEAPALAQASRAGPPPLPSVATPSAIAAPPAIATPSTIGAPSAIATPSTIAGPSAIAAPSAIATPSAIAAPSAIATPSASGSASQIIARTDEPATAEASPAIAAPSIEAILAELYERLRIEFLRTYGTSGD